MKKILIITFTCLLASCEIFTLTPQNPEWKAMQSMPNSCLPTAITFKESLGKKVKWSEVLLYRYKSNIDGKDYGHAVVAYMYPIGKNMLWTYDNVGSFRVREYITEPLKIAQETENSRKRNYNRVYYAEYLSDIKE
jgi:hypothetical protein